MTAPRIVRRHCFDATYRRMIGFGILWSSGGERGMMMTDQELQSLRNMGNEAEAAADEIERLREALAAAEADATQLASALCGKYSNVLAPFAVLMAAELHANSRKGDRPGWLSMSREVALLEIYWHTAKLSAAVKNNDAAAIREHSADVANMAMMLLDVCGGLIGGDDGRK